MILLFQLAKRYIAYLVDQRIRSYQNDLITRHCDEVQNIYHQMRGWRHDYHNHIQAMKAYLKLGEIEELDRYLGELDTDLTTVDQVIKTGNVMIDAILNSKLSLIRTRQINVNAKAAVPKELKIYEIDCCVIIGNLLDNAMEACMRQEDTKQRFIRFYMGVLKGQLYLCVTNSVQGDVKKVGDVYPSLKPGNHGFGLANIDAVVEKYHGYVNRQHEEGAFATEVMLPL